MFSVVHHFCVQAASNHSAVLQSVGDLSSLIDSCSVNGVAAVGGTQCSAHDCLLMHKNAFSGTPNLSTLTYNEII